MQVLDDVGLFCVLVYVVDLIDTCGMGHKSGGWLFQICSTHAGCEVSYSLEQYCWIVPVDDEDALGCEVYLVAIITKLIQGQQSFTL